MRILRTALRVLLCLAVGISPGFATTPGVSSRTARCEGSEFRYSLFAPDNGDAKERLPALLLLHGAGDQGSSFIETWTHLAARKGIVLIAPDLPRDPKFEDVAPEVFRCVVGDAMRSIAVDRSRIYVFGHSMGGYLAYDAAMFDSDFFAAVAVHAMFISDKYWGILGHAKRKTPIAIYSGDQDASVPIQKVRETSDRLHKAGFPVHFVEMEGHDHNYSAVADDVNEGAWKFLSAQRLPAP
jgi:dipeptidyl aminopeptidase/acylaminoacyl peptidase